MFCMSKYGFQHIPLCFLNPLKFTFYVCFSPLKRGGKVGEKRAFKLSKIKALRIWQ